MKSGKRVIALLLAAVSLLLSGCGSLFDAEYVVESTYVPTQQTAQESESRITVHSLSELRRAILDLVAAGESERQIVFDSAYEGEVSEDLASACWQARTQDAFCAYCVENISYELSRVVTLTEARLTISYTEAGRSSDSIVRMQVATGLEDLICSAMEQGQTRLAVLIARSRYTAETMGDLVTQVYRMHPALVPKEPRVTVNMFSGSGTQRLYELNLNYGMGPEELAEKQAELAELNPFEEINEEELDPAHRALTACSYLAANCGLASSGQSAYDALIGQEANSEGIALAYLELCRRLNLNCQVVYGQQIWGGEKNWTPCCWNIVELDGDCYHVDVSACIRESMETGFLFNDETAWLRYRWDVSAYPGCSGSLSYRDLV